MRGGSVIAGTSGDRTRLRGVARGRTVLAPPELKPGQVRCQVCRNGVVITDRGYLRRHHDLFGHRCHNVAIDP